MVQTIVLAIDLDNLLIAGYSLATPDEQGFYYTRSHVYAPTIIYETANTFITELVQCGMDVDIARNFVQFVQITEARVKALKRIE